MPFRLNEFRAKLQFVTAARHPSLIMQAAERTGKISMTHYLQHALIDALSRDLGIPRETLEAELPPNRADLGTIIGNKPPGKRRVGPAGTVETVR